MLCALPFCVHQLGMMRAQEKCVSVPLMIEVHILELFYFFLIGNM